MFPTLKLASLLLAATIAKAQTTTECDPLEKTCPNDIALPPKLSASFAGGIPDGWRRVPCKGPMLFGPGGVSMGFKEPADCTSVETIGMALFGLFEVKMKAAPGRGVISSVVLQSDVRDEVDWEFLGGEDYRVQSNYFGKADTTTYDRMIYVPVPNNQADFHTYGINWTAAAITWTVDGAPVRTLNYADAKGGSRFPQTPSRLKIGIWAAPATSPGVVEWAGGAVDLAKGPFAMTVSEVNIINYTPAKEYRYKDRTGNWQSIEVIGTPDQDAKPPANGKAKQDSTPPTMMPNDPVPPNSETGMAGSVPPPAVAAPVNTPVNSSTAVAAPASATKPTNTSASVTKPSSASASKPASASGATSQFGNTSAVIAGLSLFFLAFLA